MTDAGRKDYAEYRHARAMERIAWGILTDDDPKPAPGGSPGNQPSGENHET